MMTTPDDLDPGHLDELDADECRKLLATQQIGRVGVIVGHYPLIFPVNYVLSRDAIIFRTAPGTKLWASQQSNITFEVDELDSVHHSGWSVLVRGIGQEFLPAHDPLLAAPAQAPGAAPWAPGERDHFVRILPDVITGRRIRLGELPDAFDQRGYL
jgi:uncharacterized protein